MKKIYKIIFCLINGLIGVFTINFHYTIDGFGNNNEVYLEKLDIRDFLYFLIFFIIWYLILFFIDKITNKKYKNNTFKITNKKIFFITFLILLICWSFYILSFFPGGIYSDTTNNIRQALSMIDYGDGYPVFYTLYIKLIYFISFNNLKIMSIIMTFVQLIIYLSSFSYFSMWLNKYSVNKKSIIFSILFFALCPVFPTYALSLWKDSLFAIFLFLMILKSIDLINNQSKNNIIFFNIFLILASFFRNNGIYLIIIYCIFLFIIYKNNLSKKIIRNNLIIIYILFFIEIPFINMLNIKTPYKENIGIKINTLAYIVVNDGNIDKESRKYLNNLFPISKYKSNFLPMLVDTIKKDDAFNNEYLENNKLEFYKVYYKLMFKNTKMYLKEHLFITSGFWNYYLINYDMGSESLENFYDGIIYKDKNYEFMKNTDLFKKIFGISIKNDLKNVSAYLNNSALPFLIMYICIYIIIIKKRYYLLVFYIPSFLIELCLLLETPIAFSSRYVIYSIITIPLMIIIPFIKNIGFKK